MFRSRHAPIAAVLVFVGCADTDDSFETRAFGHTKSSAGHEAYLVETELGNGTSNTQVIVEYANRACVAGAVSTDGKNVGLHIRWMGPSTLEILKPNEIDLVRNPSGGRLQCRDQMISVEIAVMGR